MPNRILKESICTSDEIQALSDAEEAFFYRLMVNVDDFGLLDARPAIIKSKCFPLKSIDSDYIQSMLVRLHNVGVIILYKVAGRQYLMLTNWAKHQQIRAKKPKYPLPDAESDSNCNHPISDVHVIQSNPIQSESNPIDKKKADKPPPFDPMTIELPADVPADAWESWTTYRLAKKPKLLEQSWRLQVENLALWARAGHDPTKAIEYSIRNGYTGLFEPKKGNANGYDRSQHLANVAAELTGRHRTDARTIDGESSRVD